MEISKKSLIEISTKFDLEGLLFFRREDTRHTVRGEDIKILKQIKPNLPITKDSRIRGKMYLPGNIIPPEANSILYLKQRINKNTFLDSVHFCNLTERKDDDSRTLTMTENNPYPKISVWKITLYSF